MYDLQEYLRRAEIARTCLIPDLIFESGVSVSWDEKCGSREHPFTKHISHANVSFCCPHGVYCQIFLEDGTRIKKSAKTKSFKINGVPAIEFIGTLVCAFPPELFDDALKNRPTAPTGIAIDIPLSGDLF